MALTQRNTCESLVQDHRKVETLLDALTQSLTLLSLDKNTINTSKNCLDAIETEMNTHFACEELCLFPAVSPYHSMVLMEAEHEMLIELRQLLYKYLNNAITSNDEITKIQDTGRQFVSDMLDHIGREEAGIFPACEQSLSETEKQLVIEKMAALRLKALTKPLETITRSERSFVTFQANLSSPATRPVFSEKLLDTENYQIKHLIIQAGESLPAHWSPKCVTIICLQGVGHFIANEQDIEVSPGVCIEMTAQLKHSISAKTDCHLLVIFR